MNIMETVKSGANVQLVVSANDLRSLFKEWQAEVIGELNTVKAKPSCPDNDLLTAKEAMAKMHIGQTLLWKLEKQGVLSPVRIGRRVFYRRADIDNLLERKEAAV